MKRNNKNLENEKILLDIAHKNKLEEIETEKKARLEVEKIKHINEMELLRIKTAEIRKSQQFKSVGRYWENNDGKN
jgi:hypothetical protein